MLNFKKYICKTTRLVINTRQRKKFCTSELDEVRTKNLLISNAISKNNNLFSSMTKNICRYLCSSAEMYFKLGDESIKLSYDVSNDSGSEWLKEELIRINKQLHFLQREMGYYDQLYKLISDISFNTELVEEARQTGDSDIIATSNEEIEHSRRSNRIFDSRRRRIFLQVNQDDDKNVTLEVKSASGGSESSLFAGDIFDMYKNYSANMGWQWEEMTYTADFAIGRGCKNGIAKIKGEYVFKHLKYESGVHKVQRVPETESKGRVHSSTCQVIVLPETTLVNSVINERDLRIDTYRASGAGGQHVNTTDSAVRITHIPTGLVVTNQDEREQHRNKAKAMENLKKKLKELEFAQYSSARNEHRKKQMGSGNLNEKIRTYNWPDQRVTDHRIGLTLFGIDKMLNGENLEIIIDRHLELDKEAKLKEILKKFQDN